eukprot:8330093-Pyramimonas_sp.AAC.1
MDDDASQDGAGDQPRAPLQVGVQPQPHNVGENMPQPPQPQAQLLQPGALPDMAAMQRQIAPLATSVASYQSQLATVQGKHDALVMAMAHGSGPLPPPDASHGAAQPQHVHGRAQGLPCAAVTPPTSATESRTAASTAVLPKPA